jgi:hypothetical protein
MNDTRWVVGGLIILLGFVMAFCAEEVDQLGKAIFP